MYVKTVMLFSSLSLLAGCAGNPTGSNDGGKLNVESKPTGAEVYVMGELLGRTPLVFSVNKVFPVVYPPGMQRLYGQVVLKREGCATQTLPVSAARLAKGINVRLECRQPAKAGAAGNKQSLQDLLGLLQDGFISEQEYQTIKQRIISAQ